MNIVLKCTPKLITVESKLFYGQVGLSLNNFFISFLCVCWFYESLFKKECKIKFRMFLRWSFYKWGPYLLTFIRCVLLPLISLCLNSSVIVVLCCLGLFILCVRLFIHILSFMFEFIKHSLYIDPATRTCCFLDLPGHWPNFPAIKKIIFQFLCILDTC